MVIGEDAVYLTDLGIKLHAYIIAREMRDNLAELLWLFTPSTKWRNLSIAYIMVELCLAP